jgi:hypothetical protein
MDGNFIVSEEEGEFVFTPTKPDEKDRGASPIVFHEPDGAAIMSVDQIGKSGTHDVTKMVAILSAISKEPRPRFARLKNRDWAVCEAIFILFFAR